MHLIVAVAFVVLFSTFVMGNAIAEKVYGTVTDNNGVKVAGATVTLTLYQTGASPTPRTTLTNSNGYYEFTGLQNGAYNVQADKGGYFSSSESAIIQGSDLTIDLRIPGYDATVPTPTVPVVTITPTPVPPTPTPTPSPTPTMVPLPTQETTPGFGLLLVLLSMGVFVAIRRIR